MTAAPVRPSSKYGHTMQETPAAARVPVEYVQNPEAPPFNAGTVAGRRKSWRPTGRTRRSRHPVQVCRPSTPRTTAPSTTDSPAVDPAPSPTRHPQQPR